MQLSAAKGVRGPCTTIMSEEETVMITTYAFASFSLHEKKELKI